MKSRLLVAACLAASVVVAGPTPASAASLVVNTNLVVVADDGQCSLPEAIRSANSDTASGVTPGECIAGSGADTITFSVAGPIVYTTFMPEIETEMTIDGGAGITLDANGITSRGLIVRGGSGTFRSLEVTGANQYGIGGFGGDVTIENSVIRGNGTLDVQGSGVYAGQPGSLRISDSTISGNEGEVGAGVFVTAGSAVLTNVTISGNTATGRGGGFAQFQGSGGTVEIIHSTITDNAGAEGAGIFRSSGSTTMTITNSVVADNAGPGGDVDSFLNNAYTSGGGNVIGSGMNAANFNAPDDLINVLSAGLAPLVNNGGFSETHALLDSSVAVDRPASSAGVFIDQRGTSRPQGARVDSGAFELEQAAPALRLLPEPCAIYDSAAATGSGLAGALDGGEVRTISVSGPLPSADQGVAAGTCVPDTASSVVFTVSAIEPQDLGNLRLSAAGIVPNGGVVNYANNGLNNSNTVTVELDSATGDVDIAANGPAGQPSTDVRLVAIGFYSTDPGLDYFPLVPCAVADSRTSQSAAAPFAGPFAAGAAYPDIDVVGTFDPDQGGGNTTCGVPDSADAVVVNLVATTPSGGSGFLSAAAGGVDPFEPITAFADIGLNNAAVAYVALDGGETISIDIDGVGGSPTAGIRVVVLGYLDDAPGAAYIPVDPCAAFDTRSSQGAIGTFAGPRIGNAVTTYGIAGSINTDQGGLNGGTCGVPAGATAVLINLVAVGAVAPGNFQAYATGTSPTGGVVNFAALTPATNNSNAVIVPLSVAGQLDLRANGGAAGAGNPTSGARGVVLGYFQ